MLWWLCAASLLDAVVCSLYFFKLYFDGTNPCGQLLQGSCLDDYRASYQQVTRYFTNLPEDCKGMVAESLLADTVILLLCTSLKETMDLGIFSDLGGFLVPFETR